MVCICLLITIASCAKMAEQVEKPFGIWTQMDQRNHVLGGGLDSATGRGNFMRVFRPIGQENIGAVYCCVYLVYVLQQCVN